MYKTFKNDWLTKIKIYADIIFTSFYNKKMAKEINNSSRFRLLNQMKSIILKHF